MTSSNKHWKETIGTGVAPKPFRPAPRPSGPAAPTPPASAGLEAEETSPRPTRRAAVGPGSIAVGALSAEMPAPVARVKSTALEALELVMNSLPVGSITFSEQVGARLWADPAPAEIRDLARLLAARNDVPDLTTRDALVRTVAVLQRTRRLRRFGPDTALDATAFATRAHEWSRLAEVAGETKFVLESAPTARGGDAIAAALALLPSALELAAEADVARAAAGLIEVARGEGGRGAHQEPPPVDDAISLLGAIREGRARPGDPLLLEIWGACSLVRRDLPRAERAALEHDLRALMLADARAEESIRRAIEQEGADREAARRLLVWRRYLMEMKDRVRARVEPPKPATPPPATAPVGTAAPAAAKHAPASAAGDATTSATKDAQGLLFRTTTKLMGLLKR